MKRLNIFVDETGDFNYSENSSELYGVSFTFHEHNFDIQPELQNLNRRLEKIGYTGMIHMADLVTKRGDYENFNIKNRKSIFNSIYQFSRRISAEYYTIFVNKKYADSSRILKKKLSTKIKNLVKKHDEYFRSFDKIVMYYDNGQKALGLILDGIFSEYNGFEHRDKFNHKEKRLFQVADMLTFIDKYDYKYKNKMVFTKSEKYFFGDDEIRKILKELKEKRF